MKEKLRNERFKKEIGGKGGRRRKRWTEERKLMEGDEEGKRLASRRIDPINLLNAEACPVLPPGPNTE